MMHKYICKICKRSFPFVWYIEVRDYKIDLCTDCLRELKEAIDVNDTTDTRI